MSLTRIDRLPKKDTASGTDRVLVYSAEKRRTYTADLSATQAGRVDWVDVQDKPEEATRWPAVAEVGGLAGALDGKLDAASRYTDAEAVSAVQADPTWQATQWNEAYSWGDHALAGYLTSVAWDDVQNKPVFAAVATSGAYSDLAGTPLLGTAAAADTADFDATGSAQAAQDYAVQRSNHTGTQPLSTISDAGTMASRNVFVSDSAPDDAMGADGDIWLEYTSL